MAVLIRSLDKFEEETKGLRLLLTEPRSFSLTDSEGNPIPAKRVASLFKLLNPGLFKVIKDLDSKDKDYTRRELAELFEIEEQPLNYYLLHIKPELTPKREKIRHDVSYLLAAEFMPLIEGWETSSRVASDLELSDSFVNQSCRSGKIEGKFFLKKWRVSPVGFDMLKDLRGTLPAQERFYTTQEAAELLGCSASTLLIHRLDKELTDKRYKQNHIWTESDIRYLRNNIRTTQNSFSFGGKEYHSMASIAREIVDKRELDANEIEKLVQRYSHLRSFSDFNSLKKAKRWFFDGKSKMILEDIMLQAEAGRMLRLKQFQIKSLCDRGILNTYTLGNTKWVSYSSCEKYKDSGKI